MKKGRCCGFGHCECEPLELIKDLTVEELPQDVQDRLKYMSEDFKEGYLIGYNEMRHWLKTKKWK